MVQQIIVITDGCSNVGLDPVTAAAQAREENIIVNVIGVVDEGDFGLRGTREIEEMAKAGGGLSKIVHSKQLSQTVQMMTRKTVVHTIQQVVNEELQHIIGSTTSLEDLHPNQREKVVDVIEDLEENMLLRVVLLVDASASMKPKINAVEDAVHDLMLSLQAREGKSEVSLFHFPGSKNKNEPAEMDLDWSTEYAIMKRLFYKINMRGATPTGPALLKVIEYMVHKHSDDEIKRLAGMKDVHKKGAMLSDYIV
ncbi:vWA domain-containing protein [Chengkuizengella marina]|uniref:VWA domain-containing protein n=1 Tax=Chengkuizengella marina TaxID=2507566 RepID=A0A6N9Q832_9BACL|nr:VWA domain-containing protein [Chengkuizengella marina]NBI30823.1 VWA domain-containing protein [Chengkuizengella marina]